jgi:hypothetical protein
MHKRSGRSGPQASRSSLPDGSDLNRKRTTFIACRLRHLAWSGTK